MVAGGQEARGKAAFVAGASMFFEDNPAAVEGNAGWVNDRRTDGFTAYKGPHYQRMWAGSVTTGSGDGGSAPMEGP